MVRPLSVSSCSCTLLKGASGSTSFQIRIGTVPFRWSTRANDVNSELILNGLERVIDMSKMFCNAYAFHQGLSGWETSSVQDMSEMFQNATSFNQPLVWNTTQATDVSRMFQDATSFNQPLRWDTRNVIYTSRMFHGATSFRQRLLWDVARGCVGEDIFSDPNEVGALAMVFPSE